MTTSGESARYRRSDAVIEDAEYEAIYDEAERLADLLESLGWVCGHPYREDVIVVLRLAMNAGFFAVAPTTEPDPPSPLAIYGESAEVVGERTGEWLRIATGRAADASARNERVVSGGEGR